MLQPCYMNDQERGFYDMGVRHSQQFRADPYRDTYQDVFKAETSEWKLWVGYSDPEGEYDIRVHFKDRDREARTARTKFSDAMVRVARFMAEHPAPRPSCLVDY